MATEIKVRATNDQDRTIAKSFESSLKLSPKQIDQKAQALRNELAQDGYTHFPYLSVTHSKLMQEFKA